MSERTDRLQKITQEITELETLIETNKRTLTKKPDNSWQIESILKKQEEKHSKLLQRKLLISY